MADIVVYTVITGGYDTPKPCVRVDGVEYVAVTDGDLGAGWRCMSPMCTTGDVRRDSRLAKCMPHRYFPEATYSIYFDGAFEIRADVRYLLDYVRDADIAAFAHHGGHKSYHDERDFYQRHHGYVPEDIEAHYRRMIGNGIVADNRFWACGVIVRKHSDRVNAFGEAWWDRYITGSHNDQFSFVEALADHPLDVATIPGVNIEQPQFPWTFHGR